MIWLIGNRGMLGREVQLLLNKHKIPHVATDLECDITQADALERFTSDKKIEWIVNCSAYTAVDQAEDDRERAYQINANGAGNIAAIADTIKARLIHVSTDYVFSGEKHGAYTEEDDPGPQTIYGQSKLAGEQLVQQRCTSYFILRTAWMYGRYGKNFVKTMLAKFNTGTTLKIVDDQWGTPTLATDLADAILQILHKNSSAYGIYHTTNQGSTTWYRFTREIYKQASALHLINSPVSLIPVSSAEYHTKAKRPMNSVLAIDKLSTQLGITMRSWQAALKEYLKNEVDHAARA